MGTHEFVELVEVITALQSEEARGSRKWRVGLGSSCGNSSNVVNRSTRTSKAPPHPVRGKSGDLPRTG